MATTINNIKVDFGLGATPPRVTFLQGCNMDISNIRDTIRQIEESEEGRGAPGAVSSQGTGFGWIAKADGNYRFTETETASLAVTVLPPFEMLFEAGPIPFSTSAGNLLGNFLESPGAIVQINNAVGATNISSAVSNYASFNSAIHWDFANGKTSITNTDTDGNEQTPLKNIEDVYSQLVLKGFKQINVISSATISGASNDFSAGYKFQGFSPVVVVLTIDSTAVIDNCEFNYLQINGAVDNGNIFRDCLIGNVTSFDGYMENCGLNGTITLGGSSQTTLIRCFSNIAGGSTPYVDCGGSGSGLAVRGYEGGLGLKNRSGTDPISIDLSSGQVVVDADVTNTSNMFVRGKGRIRDNSNDVNPANKIDYVGLDSGERTVRGSGYVFVSSTSPTRKSGTDEPIGSEDFPSDNIADAITIAHKNDVKYIRIEGSITTAGTEDLSDFRIEGASPLTTQFTVTAGTTTTDARFYELILSGALSGDGCAIERCQVGNVTGVKKYIVESFFFGTTQFTGSTSIARCAISPEAPNQRAYFDFNNISTTTLIISEWGAGIAVIENMVTGSFAGASGTGGRLEVNSNNAGGIAVFGGSLLMNGINLDKVDEVRSSNVGQAVAEHDITNLTDANTIGGAIKTQDKILRNKTETNPVTGIMTVYEDDGVTVAFTANIWENISATTPYAGNAVNRRERLE